MITIKQSDYMWMGVDISPLDEKYTQMQMVQLKSQVYDSHNKVWLDGRNFRVMMSKKEMVDLANHLIEMSGP